MTFDEMHELVDVELDKHDLPWFETEEKDLWLNLALNEFVKTRYREFEINEKRREDIRTLIRELTGTTASVVLPGDFMFALSLKGEFSVIDCGQSLVKERSIRPAQHDDINKMKSDPFNTPDNNHPLYVSNQTGYTIESESTPVGWTLTYLKLPNPIDATNNGGASPDLPEYTHEEIVNIAVRKIMGNIEKETYQLQVNEINNQE
jgi:hypothetical protein